MKIIKGILIVLLILLMSVASASGSVSDLKITPDNPVVGEEIKISGKVSDPPVVLIPMITFKENLEVKNCKYKYKITTLTIPKNNDKFIATAENAESLTVKVNKFLSKEWTENAVGGKATVTKGPFPMPFDMDFNIFISGNALDCSSDVLLTFTASSKLTVDKEKFEYTYHTKGLPPGFYTLTIGGVEKTIELAAKKSGESHKSDKSQESDESHKQKTESISSNDNRQNEHFSDKTSRDSEKDSDKGTEVTKTEPGNGKTSHNEEQPEPQKDKKPDDIFQRFLNFFKSFK